MALKILMCLMFVTFLSPALVIYLAKRWINQPQHRPHGEAVSFEQAGYLVDHNRDLPPRFHRLYRLSYTMQFVSLLAFIAISFVTFFL